MSRARRIARSPSKDVAHRRAVQAGQDHRRTRHLSGAALRGRSRDRRDDPGHRYAHACLVAEVEVDDETGEVAMIADGPAPMSSAARSIRTWSSSSSSAAPGWASATRSTRRRSLLSRSRARPARLQRVPDAGTGRHPPARHRGAGAPRAGRPVRRQGPGRDVRQSGAAGGRQRDLQRGRRADRRTADHAGKGAARAQGAGRRAAASPAR